ncbi:MAG: glycosyltransferase family 2 protein [Cytophagales bacterium]|nr:glycosyltransferase [Bernardetiaceae bacterium]MDW8204345.1 glycosyltransferase family 2 protein [Cytophagales bacterium]
MDLSFIIPYRNREIERVTRCLHSLQNQKLDGNFEIILTDYGSNDAEQQAIASLCQSKGIIYIYYNARRQFWSRAHAINIGIRAAKGHYLAIVDVDLIYPPHFAQAALEKIDDHSFLQYQCYYLPPEQTNFEQLRFDKSYSYPVNSISESGGLVVVPRKAMYEIGGFDEYFKVWGVEDMDLKKRLRKIGLVRKVLSIQEAPTFHQWHPPASTEELMPVLWLKAMEKYEKRKTEIKTPYLNQALQEPRRPALTIFENIDTALADGTTTFTFEYPTLQSYVAFAKRFHSLPSEAALIVRQTFDPIRATENARLAGLFQKINRLLEKLSVSYRVTEYFTFETEWVTFANVRDFLFYFIADNQESIADYAFHSEFERSIQCVVIKK